MAKTRSKLKPGDFVLVKAGTSDSSRMLHNQVCQIKECHDSEFEDESYYFLYQEGIREQGVWEDELTHIGSLSVVEKILFNLED